LAVEQKLFVVTTRMPDDPGIWEEESIMQKNKLLTGLGAVALSVSMAIGTAGAAQAAPPQVQAAQVQAPKASLAPVNIVDAPVDTVAGVAAGTLDGTFTPTGFEVVDGVLQVAGNLTGTITNADGTTTPVNADTTLDVVGAAADQACDILTLNLGPLHLDVLGLVVDLDEVNLAITAVPGAGNLLGNLLCAVAGLLDGNTLGQGLANLLNRLLGLLG
jgi:hypothetical protein